MPYSRQHKSLAKSTNDHWYAKYASLATDYSLWLGWCPSTWTSKINKLNINRSGSCLALSHTYYLPIWSDVAGTVELHLGQFRAVHPYQYLIKSRNPGSSGGARRSSTARIHSVDQAITSPSLFRQLDERFPSPASLHASYKARYKGCVMKQAHTFPKVAPVH